MRALAATAWEPVLSLGSWTLVGHAAPTPKHPAPPRDAAAVAMELLAAAKALRSAPDRGLLFVPLGSRTAARLAAGQLSLGSGPVPPGRIVWVLPGDGWDPAAAQQLLAALPPGSVACLDGGPAGAPDWSRVAAATPRYVRIRRALTDRAVGDPAAKRALRLLCGAAAEWDAEVVAEVTGGPAALAAREAGARYAHGPLWILAGAKGVDGGGSGR